LIAARLAREYDSTPVGAVELCSLPKGRFCFAFENGPDFLSVARGYPEALGF
jgi:hypothetical protein